MIKVLNSFMLLLTSVGWLSLFVRTAGSIHHNHFKEPLRFSLIKNFKKILITFKDFRFLGKKNSHQFSALPVLIKITSPGFECRFSQAGFQKK
jgi:hypothetical protein